MIAGRDIWESYEKVLIELNGHTGFVVLPKAWRDGKKWIWRAEFFGAFDYVDRALLKDGYALAYYQVSDMYGCPEAVRLMKGFHDFLVREMGLCEKTVLFGFSRGALYSVNYAAAYPEDVACLYLDAPVLDIKSWPGGMGKAERREECWRECLAWYRLTEETVAEFRGNPMEHAEDLAKAGIPVLIVAGDADRGVPIEENTLPFLSKMEQAGGEIRVILKPGVDHHPHSLSKPKPIVEYIEARY